MIEEELGDISQVLAEGLVLDAIKLEHGHLVIFVYLVPRRIANQAFLRVPCDLVLGDAEVKAKLTDKETLDELVLSGERRIVPSLKFVCSYLYVVDGPDLGGFLVVLHLALVHVLVLVVLPCLVILHALLKLVELFQRLLSLYYVQPDRVFHHPVV